MSKYLEELTKILKSAKQHTIAGDAVPMRQFSMSSIDEIAALNLTETTARYAERGFMTQTVRESREQMQLKLIPTLQSLRGQRIFWHILEHTKKKGRRYVGFQWKRKICLITQRLSL